MKTALIEANQDMGVHIDGANLGPHILSNYFADNEIQICVVNKQNTDKEKEKGNKRKNFDNINEFNVRLYHKVLDCMKEQSLPIILGGDHSVAIASALASIKMHKKLGIIWLDAHADYNTFSTTITGNLHGLPLAAINGLCPELTCFHTGNYYSASNAVIIGCRDIDELELVNLRDSNVKVYTTEDVHKRGIIAVFEEAFKIAGNGTTGVHMSYDLDVIDPTIAPGVSVPATDGLSYDEAIQAADYISKHKNVIKSVDLVEFNPLFDKEKKTEKLAVSILKKCI